MSDVLPTNPFLHSIHAGATDSNAIEEQTLTARIQEKGFRQYVDDIREEARLDRIRSKVMASMGWTAPLTAEQEVKLQEMIAEEIKAEIKAKIEERLNNDNLEDTETI